MYIYFSGIRQTNLKKQFLSGVSIDPVGDELPSQKNREKQLRRILREVRNQYRFIFTICSVSRKAAPNCRLKETMRKKNRLRKAPFILLGFFLALWLIGITLNEPSRVLEQAKSICLSCIGIG